MQSPSFILAITCYLVSLVAALTASFFAKLISPKFMVSLVVIHFLLLTGWLLSSNKIGTTNYLFLAFFCVGILVSGFILRSGFPVYCKIYFSLFLFSLPVFIISPSRVLGFITTGNIHAVKLKRLHLTENYFFIEQQQDGNAHQKDSLFFKLVRELGMFHSTLARDIILPSSVDSVNMLSSIEANPVRFRVYFKRKQQSDSSDISVQTGNRDSTRDLKQVRRH